MEKNEMGAEHGTYKRKERCMQASVWNSEGKSPLGRSRYRRKNTIKIDSKGNEDLGWTDMSQFMDRWLDLTNALINDRCS
jgi:hypothetical protein